MNEYDFLYAIGRIRALERKLITAADVEQLLSADFENGLKMIVEKGWAKEVVSYEEMLENRQIEAWNLLGKINPHKDSLDFLVVKNDFHNLKASIKAFFTNSENKDKYLAPSIYDPKVIRECVFAKNFNKLPELLREAAIKSFYVLVSDQDTQLSEVILDSAALESMKLLAGRTGDDLLKKLAELSVATANIKTAARGALTKRSREFLQLAIVPCDTLDKDELVEAAVNGYKTVLDYIGATRDYSDAANKLAISMSAFEKWADDLLVKLLMPVKYQALGIGPLAAYYIAIEAEVKTLRIVLSCKHNQVSDDIIRERVRLLYV